MESYYYQQSVPEVIKRSCFIFFENSIPFSWFLPKTRQETFLVAVAFGTRVAFDEDGWRRSESPLIEFTMTVCAPGGRIFGDDVVSERCRYRSAPAPPGTIRDGSFLASRGTKLSLRIQCQTNDFRLNNCIEETMI